MFNWIFKKPRVQRVVQVTHDRHPKPSIQDELHTALAESLKAGSEKGAA